MKILFQVNKADTWTFLDWNGIQWIEVKITETQRWSSTGSISRECNPSFLCRKPWIMCEPNDRPQWPWLLTFRILMSHFICWLSKLSTFLTVHTFCLTPESYTKLLLHSKQKLDQHPPSLQHNTQRARGKLQTKNSEVCRNPLTLKEGHIRRCSINCSVGGRLYIRTPKSLPVGESFSHPEESWLNTSNNGKLHTSIGNPPSELLPFIDRYGTCSQLVVKRAKSCPRKYVCVCVCAPNAWSINTSTIQISRKHLHLLGFQGLSCTASACSMRISSGASQPNPNEKIFISAPRIATIELDFSIFVTHVCPKYWIFLRSWHTRVCC